jgi:hypothetical protein
VAVVAECAHLNVIVVRPQLTVLKHLEVVPSPRPNSPGSKFAGMDRRVFAGMKYNRPLPFGNLFLVN